MSGSAKPRDINWCIDTINPHTVFNHKEVVHQFNPDRTSYDKLLVMSGVFPSFKAARSRGFEGPIPEGWTGEIINGVGVYIYNPLQEDLDWANDRFDPYGAPWL